MCVGDIVDGPGDADLTCDILQDKDVVTVAGNHERWFLNGLLRDKPFATQQVSDRTRAFLQGLPVTLSFETPAGNALLCHAVGDDDESFLRPDTMGYALRDIPALFELMARHDVDFMLAGHSHEIMVRRFEGLTVINAGTIHQDFDAHYCLVDFENLVASFFYADAERFGELALEEPVPRPT